MSDEQLLYDKDIGRKQYALQAKVAFCCSQAGERDDA